jgi:hypothetical protein
MKHGNRLELSSQAEPFSQIILTISKPLAQPIVDKEHAKRKHGKDNVEQNEHVDVETDGPIKVKLISDNFIGEA